MCSTITGNLYDYPKYYDLVFGSDWSAEFHFLVGCFEKHAKRPVRRLFEPACGTGRLLWQFAKAGYEISGNDLNERAVAFCNARLARHGLPEAAVPGDMADFRLPRKVDAAYNPINSFRHLPDEEGAVAHLECIATALAKGGIYVLGLHLTPTRGAPMDHEEWAARRGYLSVLSTMRTVKLDRRRRRETVHLQFDVHTPKRTFRLADTFDFRTYTARQMAGLFERVPALEVVATYDFAYDLDHPAWISATTEDVVYVLRKG